jgi:signal transduction histidine kinase/ActR/RegA family two-component response regulator
VTIAAAHPLQAAAAHPAGRELTFQALPRAAQIYVAAVLAVGTAAFLVLFPVTYPRPLLFVCLLGLACLTSIWKVNMPIPLASGATLSVSTAVNVMTMLLLGPGHAVAVAVAGAWVQCTVNVSLPYPWYRTTFSAAAQAVTMGVSWLVYRELGGTSGIDFSLAPLPIGAAIATYFLVNSALIAGAIASSTRRSTWTVWRDDCLWSGMSFVTAGLAGALAAAVIDRGEPWSAALVAVPVYLTYRTYRLFVGRLSNEKTLTSGVMAVLSDRIADAQRDYRQAVEALMETQMAERELAHEKGRLAETVADMTRLEQLRARVLEREQAARADAERANHLKDEFLATVSHELRTPLNAILGWSEMLRSGALEDARRDRACQAIYTSARHQAQLVNELLDVARIMSGKLRLDLAAVDLKDIVRGAVEVVQPAADAKGIDVAAEDDLPAAIVYGDATRLQQVVSNLLSNSVKFTPSGGSVRVYLRRDDDCAELAVTDTGQGIAADFLPSVFEPFRQAEGSTTTRVHGGLGLGLSIVKHLVEAHHGTVSVTSGGDGQGSTFTVRLPVAEIHGNQIDAIAADSSSPPCDSAVDAITFDRLTVLVVDDYDASRHVMAAHLERRHATVLTAASAREAFDLLQGEHVDVLLADVGMPGEDGYALIRRLRALSPSPVASIPAAAVTAFASPEDRRQALDAGFDLHLTKPLDARSLVDAVARLAKANPT